MLILYCDRECPYCGLVYEHIVHLGLDVDIRDGRSFQNRSALVAHGGKAQVPYLIDEATGEAMYETSAIIRYLHCQYNQTVTAAVC